MKLRVILPIILILLLTPFFASATSLLPPCAYSGNCGVCDIVDVLSRVMVFVLGFLGVGMFVVFTAGVGYYLIWGRGNQEKVQKGKDLIKGTLYGAMVVLVSWQIVNLVLYILGSKSSEPFSPSKESFKLFNAKPWDYICEPGQDIDNIGNINLQVCFSRGDGTPCTYTQLVSKDNIKEGATSGGLCVQGQCCKLGRGDGATMIGNITCANTHSLGSACAYLRASKATWQYFKDYTCQPKENDKKSEGGNKRIECLKDTTLCPTQGELCCGPVEYPFGAPQ